MSKIGNRILILPEGVKFQVSNRNFIKLTGPRGELSYQFKTNIKFEQNDNKITTSRINNVKHNKQLHGTYNSLLSSMIKGVSVGFKKQLNIVGVGYRANLVSDKLTLSLGFHIQ